MAPPAHPHPGGGRAGGGGARSRRPRAGQPGPCRHGRDRPRHREPEVRAVASLPERRGFALCWLVDHGLEEPEALFDPDDVSSFVDVLAHRLVTQGIDELCDTLALAGDHERQVALIGGLWRSPSPATELVLAALGETHPVKVVAKAARKALFKRRSWNAL